MGKGHLLDTNFIIYYLGGVLPESVQTFANKILTSPANLSVITKIELLSWNPPASADESKPQLFIDRSRVIGLDEDIIKKTIAIRKYSTKIKLPDAMIAATAISYQLTLVTRNSDDFKIVTGLEVINPYELRS